MRRRQLKIDTRFSDSDDDIRQVLNIQQGYYERELDDETYNNLCRICVILLRLEEKRLEDGFNLIKQSAEDYNRNTQYRYSKMLEAEKKYRSNKQSDQLKFRSRSQNIQRLGTFGFDKSTKMLIPKLKFRASSKQSKQSTVEGKNIMSKLNNLQKLVKKMKRQTQISNKTSVIYCPQQYRPQYRQQYRPYSRYNSERYLYNHPMVESQYHVVQRNEQTFDPNQYNSSPFYYPPHAPLPRSTYRGLQVSQRFQVPQSNFQRSQRLRTQQTVSIKQKQQTIIAEQLKEIKKDLKQLIQLNIQVLAKNILHEEKQQSEEQSQLFSRANYNKKKEQRYDYQLGSPKVTLKQTQPTYRSYQQTINFQVEDFSQKEKSPHVNYVIQKKSPYKRYNTGGSYDD